MPKDDEPQIVLYFIKNWGKYLCRSSGNGGCKCFRNKLINIFVLSPYVVIACWYTGE
jgi:hypothetical protein